MTRSAFTPDKSVMISSVSPSLKNSLSASALMFVNGSMATDFSLLVLSGRCAVARGPEPVDDVRKVDTTSAPVA